MAYSGTGIAGKVLTANGVLAQSSFQFIGTNSGLTNNGILLGGGLGPFTASSALTNGQILIGSTGAAPVVGTITSTGGTITVTQGAGTLNLDVVSTIVNAVEHLTADSGGLLNPSANNFNLLGSGSLTTVGSGSTITMTLTGLTNHAVLVGAGTTTITKIAATANTGAILQNNSGADPSYSTATFPSTTTVSQILYSSATNVVSGLATANNGTLITSATGVPSLLANGTTGQVLTATTGSPPSWAAAVDLHTAKFIAGNTSNGANYSTIQAAITAASTGDTVFIQTGSYTENLTLKAGVNLSAFQTDNSFGTVTIIGKATLASGTCVIAGIRVQTNSDNILALSGTGNLTFKNCDINATNGTAVVMTSSGELIFDNCIGNIGTTGITLFTMSAGSTRIRYSNITNSGVSTTASTASSASSLYIHYSIINFAITTSNTALLNVLHANTDTSAINTTSLTINGTGQVIVDKCFVTSGTASGISIGAGASGNISNLSISSTNTNPLTGAGTINFGIITYTTTGILNNTTTQTGFLTDLGKFKATQQSAFLAQSGGQANVTGDGTNVSPITFTSEIFDQGGDFASSTYTAPITARVQLSTAVTWTQAIAATQLYIGFNTSNRFYQQEVDLGATAVAGTGNYAMNISILADMDVGDTAIVYGGVAGLTKTVDVVPNFTYFSGYIAC